MKVSPRVDTVNSFRDKGDVDLYLLRGLIWCDFCALPMTTVLDPEGIRSYGCINSQCSRPLTPSEEVEQLVWHRFTLLNEAFASAVKRHQRQAALREVLGRVTVHSGASDLYFEWRD